MNTYQKLSVVLALMLYLPLARDIWTGKITQNLATFILWGTLDTIAAISIFLQGGNYQLPSAYVAGCVLIVGCILKTGTFEWTWFETAMSICVCVCLIGWAMSGSYLATILSTIGVVLAGLPQLKDTLKDPDGCPTLLYFGYTIANLLSTIGGKAWVVEERLYPVACLILCLVIALASLRKTKKTEPDLSEYYGQ